MDYISLRVDKIVDIDVPVEARSSGVDHQSVSDMGSRTRRHQCKARRRCSGAFRHGLQKSHRLAIGPDPKPNIKCELLDPTDFVDSAAKTVDIALGQRKSG